ncbi:D-glucuronyl C5-epimerase family protein [Anaeromusa sp.]|mgnify:CR=1 FL=1|uniref:D-glucuronyl C5-epimerase family protein n=1 Tax=Anaeromusa sp. TaxID=1872520 RepID=UPI0026213A85|nr:D-glucuronyl C5-epimerase family protein [Anaeromusa sp.]MDD3158974.1 D-glucuronyl C5-epimerase family protein [Anaeromusa sp.]
MLKGIRLITKWLRMLQGKSILHVRQEAGKAYSLSEIKGYYNDLTKKVTSPSVLLDETGLVYNLTNDGMKVYFAIAIFQYGLGAYDLFLLTQDKKYKNAFMRTVEWAMEHQEENGAWDAFSVVGYSRPYSSMAQGEGASLLVRAYQEIGDEEYLKAAKKAVDFMCLSVEDGGCAQYGNGKVWFKEYADKPVVLNGWIFSIWGLYDCLQATQEERYRLILLNAINTLAEELEKFDCHYWSKYDVGSTIASPFYHFLHIAQLKVMHELFGCMIFLAYANKWEKMQRSRLNCGRAVIRKAWQKIHEKNAKRIIVR